MVVRDSADSVADLDLELLLWAWLYDVTDEVPFAGMGLRRPDGSARPAWDAWLAWQ